MPLGTLCLLFFNVPLVMMMRHEKPVAEKVWSQHCEKNMIAMNDCNLCRCNANNAYTCDARNCNDVDMFGHFKDTIIDMDVGMEGRGVWRSGDSACEAGVHYRRTDLLCVCTEDGKWPNPVCRDVFQILHAVESTGQNKPEINATCISTKLYLYDCNVCFCPASGRIDLKLCTKKKCKDDNVKRTHSKGLAEEVYAGCTPTKRYRLGCQTCICLRNNRLLCDNCTVQENHTLVIMENTACYKHQPGVIFKKACNFCYCDRKDTVFCSVKKCLQNHTEISLPKIQYNLIEHIQDEYDCIPGSKYIKDCNTCHCFMLDGVKYFGCSVNKCENTNSRYGRTCVEGTSYKFNCLTCHCAIQDGEKREYCTIDDTCRLDERNGSPRALSSMNGYCEPMHLYQQECNKCRCLADGKTVACTSKICFKNREGSNDNLVLSSKIGQRKPPPADKTLIMEFIPFIQKDNYCQEGQTYMVDCNICYCMKNGNAICTTKDC